MVRLSTSLVALLLGLSQTLGVVAQESTEGQTPEAPVIPDIPVEGDVVIGFPDFNITAALAAAETELGVNGTITDTLPADGSAPTTVERLAKRWIPKPLLGAIVCAALGIAFPGKVGQQGTQKYAEWNNPSFWSATTYMEPMCVFRPTDADDISLAIRIILFGQCDFNVVSGGHASVKGLANAEDGVLIILAGLTGVKVKSGYAEVSTGERWHNVFATLDQHKLQSLGGRMAPVGVAGLVLGGGISYLTNTAGFVCDQVKNFEVVLSNGCIVNANKDDNADLFRALKGGSSNFGVVTRIDLYTWPSPAVYSGQLYFPVTDYAKLWDVVYNYHTSGAITDPSSHLISAFVYVGAYQMHMGAFTVFRNTSVANAGPALQPVLDVNPGVTQGSTLQVRSYGSQADELGSGDVRGLRQDMRDFSVYANKELYKAIWDIWNSTMFQFRGEPGYLAALAFQPITLKAVQAGVARGGNSLGLEGNTKTMAVINLTHQWANPGSDAAIIAALDKVLAACIAKAKAMNSYHPYYYLNYGRVEDNVIKNYGAASVSRLQAARRKYDPYNMFRDQLQGGHKIPN